MDCTECGAPLLPRSKGWRPKRFCSNACKFAYQAIHPAHARLPRERRACDICGTMFEFLPSQRARPQFCSNTCRHAGQRAKMTGKRRVTTYKNSASFRATVRGQLPRECMVCGWAEARCDVAHIEARKNGGLDEIANVVILCPNHHRMFDSGLLPIEVVRAARG